MYQTPFSYKAAVVLAELSPQESTALFNRLDGAQANSLAQAFALVPELSAEEQEAVLQEFLGAPQGANSGNGASLHCTRCEQHLLRLVELGWLPAGSAGGTLHNSGSGGYITELRSRHGLDS